MQEKVNAFTDDDISKIKYHSLCYKETTNISKIKRDEDRYECKILGTDNDTTETTEKVLTRKKTVPFCSTLCFFCQKEWDEKGNKKLHGVQTIETGLKIANVINTGVNDILRVRLNSSFNCTDAIAAEFKYHLLCYVKSKHVSRVTVKSPMSYLNM